MKQLLTALIAASSLLMAACSAPAGQPSPKEADTALWKAVKKGAPDAYLLGTIHINRNGSILPSEVSDALKQSKQLVLETDLRKAQNPADPEVQQMAMMMYDTQNRIPLSKSLGSKRYQAVAAVLKQKNIPVPVAETDALRPWAFNMLIETTYLPDGYSVEAGTEMLLLQNKAADAAVVPLETLPESINYFTLLPNDVVLRSTDSFIAHHDGIQKDQLEMFTNYQQGRIRKLTANALNKEKAMRFTAEQDRETVWKWYTGTLLEARNRKWQHKLEKILPQAPTLAAVGTLHLFGETGMIESLRRMGYTVTPVMMKPQNEK
ncbi:TraB/GumN family protein [Neisseria chenwenguii]|uniref:Uncharacterized protein n=1 Tax=Neisseria chenwenguii TaxID=1853278 RepID=A0A220S3L4_9NEIS|nr:TraB/GumN family protein [Neisseria chenwenguii]ASK28017.1 hypothetical protein BG910_10015 [Neisseria chenwenguii]ROV57168.1 TraB/GumN family protein [Neisseria chenwenguii]